MIIGCSGKIGSGKDTVGRIIQYLIWANEQNSADLPTFEYCINNNVGFPQEWLIKKFAGKLKQIASILTGVSISDFEREDVKNSLMRPEWNYVYGYNLVKSRIPVDPSMEDRTKRYTYREFLQRIGTEAMRDQIHSEVWVNALFSEYKERFNTPHTLVDPKQFEGDDYEEDWSKSFPKWIITDVRFPNEANAVRKRDGIMIRINRPPENFIPEGDGILATAAGENRHQHPSETSLDNYKFDHVIVNDGTIENLILKVEQILKIEKIL